MLAESFSLYFQALKGLISAMLLRSFRLPLADWLRGSCAVRLLHFFLCGNYCQRGGDHCFVVGHLWRQHLGFEILFDKLGVEVARCESFVIQNVLAEPKCCLNTGDVVLVDGA